MKVIKRGGWNIVITSYCPRCVAIRRNLKLPHIKCPRCSLRGERQQTKHS